MLLKLNISPVAAKGNQSQIVELHLKNPDSIIFWHYINSKMSGGTFNNSQEKTVFLREIAFSANS